MTTDNPYTDDKSDKKAALEMDDIAKTLFARVYPLLAKQIVSRSNITSGICVDVGTGNAALSIALARITDLQIHALDRSRHSDAMARINILKQGFSERIVPVIGDVSNMPFEDDFADLIVSRGSIFFWEDLMRAFNEILRILNPGGKNHIGGGFGSDELKKTILEAMAKKDEGFGKEVQGRMNPENFNRIKTALDQSLVSHYDITQDETGFWIHMTKEIPFVK